MPLTTVYQGKIDYLQVLDKDGNIDQRFEPKIQNETLDKMYRFMVLARAWDRKCFALQRTGRMYTYAPLEGQEAIQVGSALAASPQDWLFPTYRETFSYHIRGNPLEMVNMNWMGIEEGLRLDRETRTFPYAIPISSHLPHAVGGAYALRKQGIKAACIAFCGDGATSEGDFHDALNFAGVWNAPCVFVVSNNQWAISVPRKSQTHSETIAQKALAYGLRGIQVDGNDVLAVYKSVKEAADNARNGKGGYVVECITYRMGPHTTADDPKKYRNEEEVAEWRDKDPIKRFKVYLQKKGIWNEEYEKKVNEDTTTIIDSAVSAAEAFKPDPKNIFRFLFKEMPKNLEEQMAECFESEGKNESNNG